MQRLKIEYRFVVDSGQEEVFKINMDPERLETEPEYNGAPPSWARLGFHQCENCPLETDSHMYCPAALNMVALVSRFARLLSHDAIFVSVSSNERVICAQTTTQRGIGSLMGLLMATSSCPLTRFFKPMARFHLPFASTEETIWRATSTYLLAQYFKKQAGGDPDPGFEGLSRIYTDIQTVNLFFARRLRAACRNDSMVNAIILLDMFAQSMPTAIDESLEEIHHLFIPYLVHSRTLAIERDKR